MYLSKLELHGFKSFAQRTDVQFSPGITVVVGPNGCGKSNIVDAVRWVIGEQRARILRSEKMENVIFNGTVTRKALGMAEVMLTIENTRGVLPTEYSEVTVGRRLYRSGESEYLLNGVQCRLKDITDLFMDTGMGAGAYSVIELKMIEDLLSDNAQDRRHLFEEAAGITKYKVRRGQTLRKLSSTQADLTRVRDLTEELERRVRSLERQARKAGRFKTLQEELHALETALAQAEYDRLCDRREQTEAGLKTLKDRLEEEGARLAEAEARYESHRTEHIEREQRVVSGQGRQAEQVERLRRLESDERITKERLAVAERDAGRLATEAVEAQERRRALEAGLDSLTGDLEEAAPASRLADEALTVARTERDDAAARAETERSRLENLRRDEAHAAEARADIQRTIDRTASRLDMLREEFQAIEAQIEPLRDAATTAERAARDAKADVDRAGDEKQRAGKTLDGLISRRAALQETLESALEDERTAQRRLDALDAEIALLESLLSSFDDLGEPVRHLAADTGWTDESLRTVADVLSCDEPHRAALEAAIAPFADCLVVRTEREARRAIGRLRDADKGRATFIVVDRLPKPVPLQRPDVGTPLTDSVRASDPAFSALAPVLLRDAILVASLDEALEAATSHGGGRYFAPTGEWVDHDGIVRAGSEDHGDTPGASRLGRREQLASLVKERKRIDTVHGEAERRVAKLRTDIDGLGIDGAELQTTRAAESLANAERILARLAAQHEAAAARVREMESRRDHLAVSASDSEAGIKTHSTALDEATGTLDTLRRSREQVEADVQEVEGDLRVADSRFNDARIAAVEARNRHENVLRDLERTHENLARLEKEREDRKARATALEVEKHESTGRLAELADELKAQRSVIATVNREVDAARDILSETKVAISGIESELRELRRTRETTLREENQLAVREAELKTRIEDLVASIREDFEVDLGITRFEVPEDFDETSARTDVGALRQKIRNLGPVNALALESFEEERERLDFMRTQLSDLEGAEATLLETIHEINTTASQRFDETFEAIRTNFSKLFTKLFGEEATADVVLEDPSDPLESAIEVMAKPRGKKPSVLAQLSGGEKTLTAIALLFAIYLVKPSPFCILDEVDAPLDDANIDRFMSLIRSFSDSTQFILVTHNKRTMEAADRMYGITMAEEGVSRLVGVTFEEEVPVEV